MQLPVAVRRLDGGVKLGWSRPGRRCGSVVMAETILAGQPVLAVTELVDAGPDLRRGVRPRPGRTRPACPAAPGRPSASSARDGVEVRRRPLRRRVRRGSPGRRHELVAAASDIALFTAGRASRPPSSARRPPRRSAVAGLQLGVQPGQRRRGGLRLRVLRVQLGDPVHRRLVVDLGELVGLRQRREHLAARVGGLHRASCRSSSAAGLGEPRGERRRPGRAAPRSSARCSSRARTGCGRRCGTGRPSRAGRRP